MNKKIVNKKILSKFSIRYLPILEGNKIVAYIIKIIIIFINVLNIFYSKNSFIVFSICGYNYIITFHINFMYK